MTMVDASTVKALVQGKATAQQQAHAAQALQALEKKQRSELRSALSAWAEDESPEDRAQRRTSEMLWIMSVIAAAVLVVSLILLAIN